MDYKSTNYVWSISRSAEMWSLLTSIHCLPIVSKTSIFACILRILTLVPRKYFNTQILAILLMVLRNFEFPSPFLSRGLIFTLFPPICYIYLNADTNKIHTRRNLILWGWNKP